MVEAAEAVAFGGPLFLEANNARLRELVLEFNRARKALIIQWLVKVGRTFCLVCNQTVDRESAALCFRRRCSDDTGRFSNELIPVCPRCREKFNPEGYRYWKDLNSFGLLSMSRVAASGIEVFRPNHGWIPLPEDTSVHRPIAYLDEVVAASIGLPPELFFESTTGRLFAKGLEVCLAWITVPPPQRLILAKPRGRIKRTGIPPASERRAAYLRQKEADERSA